MIAAALLGCLAYAVPPLNPQVLRLAVLLAVVECHRRFFWSVWSNTSRTMQCFVFALPHTLPVNTHTEAGPA